MREEKRQGRVIAFRPDGEFFYQKGMTFYQKGDLGRASKYINRALKMKPNDVEYLCQQAAILSELEQYESSIDILKKVVYELDTHMTECYFFMANNYAYLGDYEAAREVIRTYIALEPHGAFAHEARELFKMLTTEADDRDVEEPAYIRNHEKGRMALEHGRFHEAVGLFKEVLRDVPDFLAARNNLSIAYFSMEKAVPAIAEAEHVLEKDPGNVHALCNLAAFYIQLGRREELKQIIGRLDVLYPMLPEHCGKLGSTYLYAGDYEKAYRWLKTAEKRGTREDQVFCFWLALAAFHTGHRDVAAQNWKRVDYFSDKPFHPFTYGKIQDMMFEAEAADNFMVTDLIKKAIWADHPAYQLFSLFYLAASGESELMERVTKEGPNAQIRNIAARFLTERRSSKVNERLQIMRDLESLTGGRKEIIKHPELYSFWSVVDQLLGSEDEPDSNGWAAALFYLWEKECGRHTSQKKVADRAGTTVYRIRKCVRQLSDALNHEWDERSNT